MRRRVNRGVVSRALNVALNVVALLACASSLLCAVWIVLPAPSHFFWLVAVGASEWGLFLAALAVFGVVCGLAARRRAGGGGRLWLWLPTTVAGSIAVVLGLYPLYSALESARARGVSLSLRQYVARPPANLKGQAPVDEAGALSTYTYATIEGQELRLDAYLPPGGVERNGAAVVVVHGGSWSSGGRSDFPLWDSWLAGQGFAVFDVDYRLAPQPNLTGATGDVKCAVMWVKRHAVRFGISPERVALLGRSAGGHLALLAAYTPDDARLPPSCSQDGGGDADGSPSPSGSVVRAVVSFYGPTDLTWAYDNPANQRVLDGPAALRRFTGASPHESEEARTLYLLASPTAHVTRATPPTLLIHGGHDQLVRVENMEMLAGRLDSFGVPHREVFLAYAQHGFDYNFDGWGAQVVRPVLLDFLRESTRPR